MEEEEEVYVVGKGNTGLLAIEGEGELEPDGCIDEDAMEGEGKDGDGGASKTA